MRISADGRLGAAVYIGSTPFAYAYNTTLFAPLNQWTHVVHTFTYSYAGKALWRAWVNGSTNWATNWGNPYLVYNQNVAPKIGGGLAFVAGDGYFTGIIDEFLMYNYAFSSTEATALFNAQQPINPPLTLSPSLTLSPTPTLSETLTLSPTLTPTP